MVHQYYGIPWSSKKFKIFILNNLHGSRGNIADEKRQSQNIHWYLIAFTWRSCNDKIISSVQFSCSVVSDSLQPHESQHMPGLPVHHKLPEFTQTHVHRVSDAIQLSHPLSSSSPLAPNPSQHQSLFQWVNSSHEVAKGLEFQL